MNENKLMFIIGVFIFLFASIASSVTANGTNCTENWECEYLNDGCNIGVCDLGSCLAILNDTDGPDVFNIAVDPNPSNGVFSVSANTDDECSIVASAEFYLDNKCNNNGVDLDAEDGAYDELEEVVIKNDYDSNLDDGGHNLWILAEDDQGNKGRCEGISFEVDTIPPVLEEKEITNYSWLDNKGVWICADDAVLNAKLCDPFRQSNIIAAEYLVDNFGIPVGSGYMMSPLDGIFDDTCEDVYADIENNEFSEGRHDARVRGEDEPGNWGKLLNQDPLYFIVDRTSPRTDKELNGSKVRCEITNDGENEVESCWYITQETSISLSCEDIDNGNGYFSDDTSLYYRTRYKLELNDTWGDWNDWALYRDSFTFGEDSVHEIEYYCADSCLNEEEHHFELDLVDSQAPDANKEITGPQYECSDNDGCDWFVNSITDITLTCEDKGPHPIEDTILYWREYLNGTTSNYSVVPGGSVMFSFGDDGAYNLDYYCDDGLGNNGEVESEVYFVDNTAPDLTKIVGDPKIPCNNGLCDWWITQDTEINLECVDNGEIAVDNEAVYYRFMVDNGNWSDWILYDDAFTFGEDSEHTLEYYCVDALENMAGVYSEVDRVDSQAPVTTKTVGDPKYDKQDLFDWWITQNTEICLQGEDSGLYPVNEVQTYYRTSLDGGDWSNWTLYTDCFSYGEDSGHTLQYYSVDMLNNTEIVNEEADSVDTAAPEIEKSVVVDGLEMFGQGYAHNGSEMSVCANVHDVKQTGDDGVGVDDNTVFAHLKGENWETDLPLNKTSEEYYCGEWMPEQCDFIQINASAADYLDNFASENGMYLTVENGLPDSAVMSPHSGEYYHDGKKFSVYAPAVDEQESSECLVSGVRECRFYALEFCYDCVNDNRSQLLHQDNITAFLDELNVSYTQVGLGVASYEGGACTGILEVPENSGLSGVAMLSVEVVDKSGNIKNRLAINPLWDPITMNFDNEGPKVTIVEGLDKGIYTSEEAVDLVASVEDYDSQPSTCRLDLYGYDDSLNTSTLLVEGLAWADVINYKCGLSAVIPKYVDNELLSDGDYRLEVVALDNEDNVGSDWAGFMLDNSRPLMGVISPVKGTVFGETFSVSLNINDSLSSVVDGSVRFRFHEAGNYGNFWCLLGCSDTGWISALPYGDSLYVGVVNTTAYNLSDGNYNFDAVACDNFYIPDPSNPVGVDMNLDRNTMHCRQISEHGAIAEPRPECNDGLDNDMDGYVDLVDDECNDLEDADESI